MAGNYVNEYGLPMSGTTTNRPSNADDGATYFDETLGLLMVKDGSSWIGAGGICVEERTFTETSGAGTYTGSVTVPAGATVLDVIVHGAALWDASSTVTMKVGDATDDDGIYTGINLKATDLLAGESLSFSQSGGKAGAYNTGTNTHWTTRYSATARVISGIVTAAGTGGTAGRTRMTVIYALPRTSAATKV
jgi:hypothetical protein